MAYEFKKINHIEQNYITHEKELLTIVRALKYMVPLLIGQGF